MITLRSIDTENFWDVVSLAVAPEQQEYVVSNAVSIAQAKVQPECVPLAVYANEEPVGFVMYCIDRDDGEYWIYRLMIDKHLQGKGYGRQAMERVLEMIRRDTGRHAVYLGVHRGAAAAVSLYQSLGFTFTGQVFGQEHIMRKTY